MNKSSLKSLCLVLSICQYICSGYFMYLGRDKMVNYYNSEYSSLTTNAYVGGDAYNYIINGTYSTSFFVLAIGFLISGTLILLMAMYLSIKDGSKVENIEKSEKQSELPPLWIAF